MEIEPLPLVVRDSAGNTVEPPEGVQFDFVTFDSIPAAEDDSDSELPHLLRCIFCDSQDWQWEFEHPALSARLPIAFAPHIVCCDTCHAMSDAGEVGTGNLQT